MREKPTGSSSEWLSPRTDACVLQVKAEKDVYFKVERIFVSAARRANLEYMNVLYT